MAHFSASGDSIASLFITVRIGFERFLCFRARLLYLLLSLDVVFLIMAICLLILSSSL